MTLWDETRTKVLFRVPLGDSTVDEQIRALAESNSTRFDLVPRTFTKDGLLAVTLEGTVVGVIGRLVVIVKADH